MSAMRRPRDDDVVSISDALAWQADYCRGIGSILAAGILDAVREDLRGARLLGHALPEEVRFADLPGLRIMATVHYLALSRKLPTVAVWLPTLGGSPPSGEAQWREFATAVVTGLDAHAAALADGLARTPQTNETGRATLLRAALSRIRQPVRLREIGASAGLNLRADHLPGDPALEAGAMPTVIDRIGCDLSPIDPTTTEGRTRLTSYVWVDDLDRFERLRAALQVAQRIPAAVVAADAVDFVGSLDLHEGSTTVLWHSAMWLYLSPAARAGVLDAVADLGSRATPQARLVHASWEWEPRGGVDDEPFELVVREWGAGTPVIRRLARGRSHGIPSYPAEASLDAEPLSSS